MRRTNLPLHRRIPRSPLVRILIAVCVAVLAGCAQGRPVQIEALPDAWHGAGCTYRLGENSPVIFEVVYRSMPDARTGVARIRVDGVQFLLDRISGDDAKESVYSRGGVSVKAFDHVELASMCTSECEGSRYKASLEVVTPDGRSVVPVLAHCGA